MVDLPAGRALGLLPLALFLLLFFDWGFGLRALGLSAAASSLILVIPFVGVLPLCDFLLLVLFLFLFLSVLLFLARDLLEVGRRNAEELVEQVEDGEDAELEEDDGEHSPNVACGCGHYI